MSDEELVRGVKRRDERALDALVEEYGGLIKSVVYRHLGGELRGECINDVLFSIWQNISKFNPKKNSLKNWIGAVCKYKCIDYKRKYLKERFAELDENIPSNQDADFELISKELREEIQSLLSALPLRDREIFRLRYLDGKTIEEISAVTGDSAAVLYNRLSRGRKSIRESFLRSERNEK